MLFKINILNRVVINIPSLYKILLLIFFNFLFIELFSQNAFYSNSKQFKEPTESIVLNTSLNQSIQLKPFTSTIEVSGVTISADITLHSDSSMVRFVLIDNQLNEYLIYEAYPLLTDNLNYSIDQMGEETAFLNNMIPAIIEIEIVDASVYLKEIVLNREQQLREKVKSQLQQQQSEKINRINENIKRTGQKWIAGETSVSKMTYQEKKAFFGGKIPNLQGFEYYKGGIFVLPGALDENPSLLNRTIPYPPDPVSPYVDEFSWRNRHGQDWTTSVKNQGFCGSCWAFGTTGAVEILVNLFYNKHLDINLSEQELISCSGYGSCSGGASYSSIDYFINSGIVVEECFPYAANDILCDDKCNHPNEIIRISSKERHLDEDEQKKAIIAGATSGGVAYWSHHLTFVGYKVLRAGDSIYINNMGSRYWVSIPENDELIGKTAWLCKNSWGDNFGDNGYVYIVGSEFDIQIYSMHGPVFSLQYTDDDITCIDNDGDGYYSWGIGSKPSHCPDCQDEPDGDDSDRCNGPINEYGHLLSNTPTPIVENIIVEVNKPVETLVAVGENIRWYNNSKLSNLIHIGDTLITDHSAIGIYTYYATQNIDGCESLPDTVSISIVPPVPIAEDLIICESIQEVTLSAIGENIKWYGNPCNSLYDSRDSQMYNTIVIGNQTWMAENLNYYTNSGSWYYNNDSNRYGDIYGRLYNWKMATEICPAGWHLPNNDEWMNLFNYLGGDSIAGGKLKESGTSHWSPPNTGATNESGFKALPAGICFNPGTKFVMLHNQSIFWSSDYRHIPNSDTVSEAYKYKLLNSKSYIDFSSGWWYDGTSVRCLKDNNNFFIASGNKIKTKCTNPGIYTYLVTQTISGVESLPDTVFVTIGEKPEIPSYNNTIALCEGDSIFLEGNYRTIKGTYYDTLQTICGCDSVIITELTVHPIYDTILTAEICQGDGILLGGEERTSSGIYNDTLQTIIGCDSIIITELTVHPIYDTALIAEICQGDGILLGGEERTRSGTYYDTLQTINGCDSTIFTELIVYPVYHTIDTAEICRGDSILLGDEYFSTPGIIYDTLQTACECDSIVTTLLVLNDLPKVDLGNDTTLSSNDTIILVAGEGNAEYLWDNGSIYPTRTISGLMVGDNEYSVLVTNSDNCTTSDTIIIHALAPNSFQNELTAFDLEIFPNPTSDFLYIRSNNYINSEFIISLIDISGKVVLERKIENLAPHNEIILDLLNLNNGSYVLRINKTDLLIIQKILKY